MWNWLFNLLASASTVVDSNVALPRARLNKIAEAGNRLCLQKPPTSAMPNEVSYTCIVNSVGALVETPHLDFEAKFLGEAVHQRFD
jgi:hypothetical protein